jgi:ubiquinol-cytochrome c reductase cytochrome b subunit
MSKQEESLFTNPILKWIDDRFPLSSLIKDHATEYYASKNFNIWYIFGVLSMVVLVIMLMTGFFLTMNYKPSAEDAFNSVEYIMRSVEWGWLIRYMHSTGSSFFFIVVYLHMLRGMLYGSYKKTQRTHLDYRHASLLLFNGGSFLWLSTSMGQHVLLGWTSYCKFI